MLKNQLELWDKGEAEIGTSAGETLGRSAQMCCIEKSIESFNFREMNV